MKKPLGYLIIAAALGLLLLPATFGGKTAIAAPDGKGIYSSKCSSCHGAEGKGTPGVFPALAGDKVVTASDPSATIGVVLHGQKAMPPFKGTLSNAEIAAVVTYVRGAWGNHASSVSEQQVSAVK